MPSTRDLDTGHWLRAIEPTFAPAMTAFRTSVWHCARLWLIEDVEQIWPTAYIILVMV